MRHHYRNGELARIVNLDSVVNGQECVVISESRTEGVYFIMHRGTEYTVHWSWIEPIQFKEDIAPSFDDDLFELDV